MSLTSEYPPPPPDSGEDMNVREVHGALWREFAEPIETLRRTPWYLKHAYVMMFIIATIYLFIQVFDWNEYEENSARRVLRDLQFHQPVRPPAVSKPTQPAP